MRRHAVQLSWTYHAFLILLNIWHLDIYLFSILYLAGDGVAVKGQAYGIRSIRVDGNDALAVYSSTCTARQMAISEQRPILIEVKTDFLLNNDLANLLVSNNKNINTCMWLTYDLSIWLFNL